MSDPKIVSQLDPAGFFFAPVEADPSPLEPGTFLLPGGAVDLAPPDVQAGMRYRVVAGEWKAEPIPEVEEPEVPMPPAHIFVPRDFLRRFSMAEYAAARRSESIEVQWALDNMIAAQYIDIEDPETIAGLDLMVAAGVITPGKRDELLTPVPRSQESES